MDNQKIVIVLLILAIVFSVASVIVSVSTSANFDGFGSVDCSREPLFQKTP